MNYLNYLNFPVAIGNNNANTHASQDQYVANWQPYNNPVSLSSRIDLNYYNNSIMNYNLISNNPIILVVLESPHVHEYTTNGQPLGTLCNKHTFNSFIKHFNAFFMNSSLAKYVNANTTYNIVLLNSVQYQCSLGKNLKIRLNKITRDNNWLKCFNNNGCSTDMIKRINLINPLIVINLCTVGIFNLQMVLHNYILNQSKTRFHYSYGNHPCNWQFKKGYIL